MSWPGEQDQTPPRSEGGGRRRRRDSPPEDPYVAAQNPSGSGRRGSGEFDRPAEYVQHAQEQAAEYDRGAGNGQPAGYGQQTGYEQQPGYESNIGQQPSYGQQPGYGQQPAYGQPTAYEPASGYEPTTAYGQSASYQPRSDYDQQQYAQPYEPPPAPRYEPTPGYAEPAYFRPEGEAADPYAAPNQSPSFQDQPGYPQPGHLPTNLNSSGFYPLTPSAPAPAAPPAPPPPAPEPPRQPYAEPSRFVTRPRTGDADDASAGADTAATASEPDSDVSGWLHFVESRADLRAERSRKLRFRLILLGVVLALLATGGGLWYFLSGGDAVTATQTTVLFQVHDLEGNAVGNVVLVAAKAELGGKTDPKAQGAALLIPSELTVEGTGLDSQPFGGAMPAVPPVGKDAVTSLIGVDIDGMWSMDALTFASLIDNLIGVTVDVDVPVLDKDGKTIVEAGKGQQLTGAKAYLFATYHAKDEPPAKQVARFGEVVSGMLAKIPPSVATTTSILNSLGTVPDPALPNDRLAAILTALGAEEQGKRFAQDALPIRSDGSGLIDVDAASPVVAKLLGGAVHEKDNGGLTRVSVADGTGRMDTVSSRAMAASTLLNSGYAVLDTGVRQTVPTSYVEVPNSDATTLGKQIAGTLGLPEGAVKVAPFDTTLVAARVVLGQDWTAIAQVPADQAPEPSAGASQSVAVGGSTPTAPAAPTKPSGKATKPTASKTR